MLLDNNVVTRDWLRRMYHGRTRKAVRFQTAVLGVDLAVIAFFVVSPVIRDTRSFIWLDYAVAALLLADFVARALAANDAVRWLKQLTTWVDLFILANTDFSGEAGQSRISPHLAAVVTIPKRFSLAPADRTRTGRVARGKPFRT